MKAQREALRQAITADHNCLAHTVGRFLQGEFGASHERAETLVVIAENQREGKNKRDPIAFAGIRATMAAYGTTLQETIAVFREIDKPTQNEINQSVKEEIARQLPGLKKEIAGLSHPRLTADAPQTKKNGVDNYPKKIGNMEPRQAAIATAKLGYPSLSSFLETLANQLNKDSLADEKGGRPKLAGLLKEAGGLVAQAEGKIREAAQLHPKTSQP